ncbi:hypothetical protein [Elizabethkingia sp. JS20170427COW]|uniref:hypothetical protein n=1 Tax=Elizabethkingia sp. JS20170427COW TaxID=2583851 RepID=UPI001110F40A|nr:hypothetical protein [Elizabethkingia sp. JS20170427COW]QCX52920.1 hypothetical protein FGE20_03785 [Elizabethkingia sp. JS20170427COW]
MKLLKTQDQKKHFLFFIRERVLCLFILGFHLISTNTLADISVTVLGSDTIFIKEDTYVTENLKCYSVIQYNDEGDTITMKLNINNPKAKRFVSKEVKHKNTRIHPSTKIKLNYSINQKNKIGGISFDTTNAQVCICIFFNIKFINPYNLLFQPQLVKFEEFKKKKNKNIYISHKYLKYSDFISRPPPAHRTMI